MLYKWFGKPLLFQMDPEQAHHVTLDALHKAAQFPGALGLIQGLYSVPQAPELEMNVCGIRFQHPIGLAAGLDKNARAIVGFSSIGLSFMEVGTVTPLAQPGNEQPRLFRLPPDQALINRMGFNNDGADEMIKRIMEQGKTIPLGINIGKNKMTANESAAEDYKTCISKLYPYGDFFVVNISSPNTPDLRKLQLGEELSELLTAVNGEMQKQAKAIGIKKPVFVKIAPDLSLDELDGVLETFVKHKMDGIIATNTTLSRDGLQHAHANEAGGLSGKPLKERSTEMIRHIYRSTSGKLPIIGSGGIFDASDAWEKIKAGASLVEVYTGLIYEGPRLLSDIHSGLRKKLRQEGFSKLSDAVGIQAND